MDYFDKDNELEEIIRGKIDAFMKKKGYVAGVGKERKGTWFFPLLHAGTGELVFWATVFKSGRLSVRHV